MNGNAGNAPKQSPLMKAAGLWARSSVKGGQYLTGRLGAMKVLILENRDRQNDDDPSHILYFTEAQPRQERRESAQECGDGARAPQGQRAPQPYGSDWQAPLRQDGSSVRRNSFEDGPEWER
jgi:hypothetical protein